MCMSAYYGFSNLIQISTLLLKTVRINANFIRSTLKFKRLG